MLIRRILILSVGKATVFTACNGQPRISIPLSFTVVRLNLCRGLTSKLRRPTSDFLTMKGRKEEGAL